MKFLTARWSNLFIATYSVPEHLLKLRLPAGLELDRRDGQCYVSLVAFDFLETKVLGIPWLGFRNFPELNLRFYVRHGNQRGVAFVQEYVPLRFVSWTARMLYNEPYRSAPMSSTIHETPDSIRAVHRLEYGGRMHTISASGSKPAVRPEPDSVEHFFAEHEWGFGTTRRGRTLRYCVEHPVWDVYPVLEWDIDLDWTTVYGREWSILQDATPYSTLLAAGSKVAVYAGKRLNTGIILTPP